MYSSWRPLAGRVLIVAILLVVATWLVGRPPIATQNDGRDDLFAWVVVQEAWSLAWREKTSVLSLAGIAAVPFALFIKLIINGWIEMRAHLVKHLLESVIPAALAILCIFAWKAFITVPRRIWSEASFVSAPHVIHPPSPPKDTDALHTVIADRPQPVPAHTTAFMQIERPEILQEFSDFAPGKQWGGNVHSTNPGPQRLFNVYGFSKSYVMRVGQEPDKTDTRVLSEFTTEIGRIRLQYFAGKIKGLPQQGVGSGPWTTVLTDPLSASQIDGFFDVLVRIYFASFVIWQDSNGHSDYAIDCRCLQPLPRRPYSKTEIVWHFCTPQ